MHMAERSTNLRESRAVQGGRISGTEWPAFSLLHPENMPIPVLISAPHGGRSYPDELIDMMRRPEYACLKLEDRYIDALASEVARQSCAALLTAHAPRAMLDLNRAPQDVDWDMVIEGGPEGFRHSQANRRARSGLGLVPRRLNGLGEIWKRRITSGDLDDRVEGIHKPYHECLSRTLESIRDEWGAALLVDLHSMPPLKAKHANDEPAQFVIGDRFGASCDASIVSRAFGVLENAGRPVAHNRPYAGGYVLERHAAPQRGIHAVQIEVCRSIYLDSRLSEPNARLALVARQLATLVRELGAGTARLALGKGYAQAAE